jgi:hypothetical protein
MVWLGGIVLLAGLAIGPALVSECEGSGCATSPTSHALVYVLSALPGAILMLIGHLRFLAAKRREEVPDG